MVTFSSILVSSLRFSPCCCVSVLLLPWYTVGSVISGNSLVGLIVSELQVRKFVQRMGFAGKWIWGSGIGHRK